MCVLYIQDIYMFICILLLTNYCLQCEVVVSKINFFLSLFLNIHVCISQLIDSDAHLNILIIYIFQFSFSKEMTKMHLFYFMFSCIFYLAFFFFNSFFFSSFMFVLKKYNDNNVEEFRSLAEFVLNMFVMFQLMFFVS